MSIAPITERAARLRAEVPPGVAIVAAAKMRTPDEVRAALDGGLAVIGENYVQEAAGAQAALGRSAAEWHFIGHLQRNKAKEAARLFDLVQTVDSLRIAAALDAAARAVGRVVPVLVEVNCAREPQKAGVFPEDAEGLVREIDALASLRIAGLMTMGPIVPNPEALRPWFRETRALFDRLARLDLEHGALHILSMGMSDSYRVAIDEGSTMVRIGTALFGPR